MAKVAVLNPMISTTLQTAIARPQVERSRVPAAIAPASMAEAQTQPGRLARAQQLLRTGRAVRLRSADAKGAGTGGRRA